MPSTKVMANKMVGREVNFETEKEPAKPGKTILSIEKLNVYNKQDFQVVKDVSLEVHSGEIVAIAGVAGNPVKRQRHYEPVYQRTNDRRNFLYSRG